MQSFWVERAQIIETITAFASIFNKIILLITKYGVT